MMRFIKAVQRALTKLGLYSGKIDGQWGTATAAAYNQWCISNNVVNSGLAISNKEMLDSKLAKLVEDELNASTTNSNADVSTRDNVNTTVTHKKSTKLPAKSKPKTKAKKPKSKSVKSSNKSGKKSSSKSSTTSTGTKKSSVKK